MLAARNRAYTFFTTPGFSFGEGWYLAAASLFAELTIQVRTGTPQERQALQFLNDVGLAKRLVPYRPRPASPNISPTLLQRHSSVTRIQRRKSFAMPFGATTCFGTDCRMAERPDGDRHTAKGTSRHASAITTRTETRLLMSLHALANSLPTWDHPCLLRRRNTKDLDLSGGIDLTLCWRNPLFQTLSMRRDQLQLFEVLRRRHHLVGQIGVTTAGWMAQP